MAIEIARTVSAPRPWGIVGRKFPVTSANDGIAIGDITYRIFDYGRERELHIESAIAVANTGPSAEKATPVSLSDERTLLVSDPHFCLERICLPPGTTWWLEADRETWLLVVSGLACLGSFDILTGDAAFAQSDRVNVQVGPDALVGLVAYTGLGGPVSQLLKRLAQPASTDLKLSKILRKAPSITGATSGRDYEPEGRIR